MASKFGPVQKKQQAANAGANVASLDAARIARQHKASEEQHARAEADMRRMLAQQVHMPVPPDSPLGQALETAVSSAWPQQKRAEPEAVQRNDLPTGTKPVVPQGKAGQDNG